MMDLVVRRPRELGQAMRRIREERGVTQQELADMIGASRRWVLNTEAGANPGVQFAMVSKAMTALKASVVIRLQENPDD